MKKLIRVGTAVGIIALMVMLVVGSASADFSLADGPRQIEPEPEPEPEGGFPGEGEPEPGGGLRGDAASLQEDAPAEPSGTAVRINFEVSGHRALRGLYVIQEAGGEVIATWYALNGWTDSGWFENIDIPRETIYVQVLYYPGPNTNPTVMEIVNHAHGSAYGWISRGIGHALEVAWPEGMVMSPIGMGERPDGSTEIPDRNL